MKNIHARESNLLPSVYGFVFCLRTIPRQFSGNSPYLRIVNTFTTFAMSAMSDVTDKNSNQGNSIANFGIAMDWILNRFLLGFIFRWLKKNAP